MSGRIARLTERGQSTVEYALVVLPFFLLVLGSVDLGRGIFYHQLMASAARDAARAGIAAGRTPADMCAAALRTAGTAMVGVSSAASCGGASSSPVVAGPLTITVSRPAGPAAGPTYAVAQLTYEFQPITPLMRLFIGTPGGTVSLSTSSTMYIEPE